MIRSLADSTRPGPWGHDDEEWQLMSNSLQTSRIAIALGAQLVSSYVGGTPAWLVMQARLLENLYLPPQLRQIAHKLRPRFCAADLKECTLEKGVENSRTLESNTLIKEHVVLSGYFML